MPQIAVITGDIIHSREIQERPELAAVLDETFNTLKKAYLGKEDGFEIYRGDSFQGVVSDPSQVLKVALILKSRLKCWEYTSTANKLEAADARIAIGVGEISYRGNTIGESDGEAFYHAARVMENLEKSGDTLGIMSSREDINDALRITAKMAGAIIDQWSVANAEAIYWMLLKDLTQKNLSKQLNISQPAVNKRLQGAHYSVINAYIEYYSKEITKKGK